MHYRTILRVNGFLLCFLACTMTLPLFWALYYGTGDARSFLLSIPLAGIPGLALSRIKGRNEIWLRDAFTIVAGGWLLSAVVGSLPFLLAGTFTGVVDALFESMSGITTTGATVLTDIEGQGAGILFWRSFLHWLGGMGIIVISLAILPRLELGGSHLFKAEVPGPQVQRLRPRLRETARVLYFIYGGLTLAQTVALCVAGMSLYDALIHTFGTMATGGFSNHSASVGAYASPVIETIIIIFMISAGVNFNLYHKTLLRRSPRPVLQDPEFKTYATILAVATGVVGVSLLTQMAPGEALRAAAFHVVSIMTTTGFTTADFDRWPELTRTVLLLLMFVGASAGSTGGSIKVVRLMIVVRHSYREIYRLIHSSAILPLRYGDDLISESTVRQVLAFTAAYLACFLAATVIMVAMGLDMLSATASVAATLGNIGPGLGAVGPSLNYAPIPLPGKLLLTLLMMLGRLEIFTVLVILSPAFWKR